MQSSRLIAWAALVTIALGTGVLTYGAHVSREARMALSPGGIGISAESPYVVALYERSVPDDPEALLGTYGALRRAGRDADASALLAFYDRCRMDRLRGDDAACRSQTVRAAIAASPVSAGGRRGPVSVPASAVRERFDDVLSFAFADSLAVPVEPGNPDNFANWYTRASGSVWAQKQGGGYLFLAVSNRAERTIEDFKASLELPGADTNDRLRLDCHKSIFPFSYQAPLEPSATAYAICGIHNSVAIERILDAVGEAQELGGPTVRVRSFVLVDPFVRIEDRAVTGPAELTVATESVLSRGRAFDALDSELRSLGCEQLGTCQSQGALLALGASNALDPPLLVVLSGFLLGLVVGGFARSVWKRGLQIGVTLLAVIAVAVGAFVSLLDGGDGWGSMAAVAILYYSMVGAVMWIPAYLVGLAAMSALRGVSREPPLL